MELWQIKQIVLDLSFCVTYISVSGLQKLPVSIHVLIFVKYRRGFLTLFVRWLQLLDTSTHTLNRHFTLAFHQHNRRQLVYDSLPLITQCSVTPLQCEVTVIYIT